MKVWRCECGLFIGNDYKECPMCSQREQVDELMEFKKYIQNKCCSCGIKFDNNPTHYKMKGNFCSDCSSRIENKMKWFKIKNDILKRKKKLEEARKNGYIIKTRKGKQYRIGVREIKKGLTLKEIELKKLTDKMSKRWELNMEKDYHDFNEFRKFVYNRFLMKKEKKT